MHNLIRKLSCREIGVVTAILAGWFFLSAEQAIGIALCVLVGLGMNALLNRIVERGALDEE
jgi:hypothetical protein